MHSLQIKTELYNSVEDKSREIGTFRIFTRDHQHILKVWNGNEWEYCFTYSITTSYDDRISRIREMNAKYNTH